MLQFLARRFFFPLFTSEANRSSLPRRERWRQAELRVQTRGTLCGWGGGRPKERAAAAEGLFKAFSEARSEVVVLFPSFPSHFGISKVGKHLPAEADVQSFAIPSFPPTVWFCLVTGGLSGPSESGHLGWDRQELFRVSPASSPRGAGPDFHIFSWSDGGSARSPSSSPSVKCCLSDDRLSFWLGTRTPRAAGSAGVLRKVVRSPDSPLLWPLEPRVAF